MTAKARLFVYMALITGLFTAFSSCNSDEVGDNLYTFTGKMLAQQLAADTSLTEFSALIERSGMAGLLNSYGKYTCFAPDNNAMRAFYAQKSKHSLDEFTDDSLKMIAYDHIINGAVINYVQFNTGRLFNLTMSDRYLAISFSDDGKSYVNKTAQIIGKDINVHNGVIHKINRVLDPIRSGIAEVIAQDTKFSLFYEALEATGLVDSLLKTVDENYQMTPAYAAELENALITSIKSERYAPYTRKYGYTVLMESNETYLKNGVSNLTDLKNLAALIYNEIYPDDAGITDPTDRRNSLNRFVAYHLINKELSYTKFILDYNSGHMSAIVDMYEYIETMCPNTLIEVKLQRSNGEANIFNLISETNQAIRLVSTNYDNDATNGVYHEIDGILSYNKAVDNEISSKRLRFDFASLFPELSNNNMRGRKSDNGDLYRNALPKGYLERFVCTDQTVLCYSAANDKLMNYMGDEFFIVVQNGKLYDFVVTTPPVPAGTYEVRFGYQSNGRRGVAQFYVDGIPCGVPVNLNTGGTDIGIGYEKPDPTNSEDPYGYENDKVMRNRGYMKGPNSFKAINETWYAGSSARFNASNLRKILGTFTFPEAGNHKLMVKGLSGGQFQIDFIEFVPTNMLESENID